MKKPFLILAFIVTTCSFSQKTITKGPLSDDSMLFEYAVYFLDDHVVAIEDAKKMILKKYPMFGIIDSLPSPESVKGSQLVINQINNVKELYPPADLEYLEFTNQGLNESQKLQLQNSKHMLLLDFICEKDKLVQTMKKAHELIRELTKNKSAVIYDAETRESFSTDFWKDIRTIKSNSLNISRHITIHFYRKEEYCRAITLGMRKFGLPDLSIENLSCQSSLDLSGFVNLTAQTLLEEKRVKTDGILALNIDEIKNDSLREMLLSSTLDNAEKNGQINIIEGTWEEGDPENRLIEIAFAGNNPQIVQNELVSKIFGSKDEVTSLTHDNEILAASERAKAKAPELLKRFSEGLATNSYLLLKFPFDSIDGRREWMWVEVTKWDGNIVKGLLQNEPYYVKSLKAGQIVSKNIKDMFDYILYKPDGTQEGNETGAIIMKKNN